MGSGCSSFQARPTTLLCSQAEAGGGGAGGRRWRGGLCAVIRPLMSPQESFWVLSAGVLLQEGLWVHLDFIFRAILVSWGGQSGTVSPKERRRAWEWCDSDPPPSKKKLELFFSCDNSLAPGSTREVLTCRRRRLPSQSPRQTLARRLHTPIKFGRPPLPAWWHELRNIWPKCKSALLRVMQGWVNRFTWPPCNLWPRRCTCTSCTSWQRIFFVLLLKRESELQWLIWSMILVKQNVHCGRFDPYHFAAPLVNLQIFTLTPFRWKNKYWISF